ncbi:FAD:protein FMN transferase [soil metagenome]
MTTSASVSPAVLEHRFEAMATPVTMRVFEPTPGADALLYAAEALVRAVDRSCSRFRPDSELSLVNNDPAEWHDVSPIFAAAVTVAEIGAIETSGRIDPRVLDNLEDLGYSVTFDLIEPDGPPRRARLSPRLLTPFRAEHSPGRLRLDGTRIDLGGVAKGLAVDRAAAILAGAGSGVLVEAGGDLAVLGTGPDSGVWNVDVEDPLARGLERDTIAVLAVAESGVATSSVRHRSWHRGGLRVHHLIDPATGESANTGIVAVTVIAESTVVAERWSKALFLAGSDAILAEADERGIAALWVDDVGVLRFSREMDRHILWRSADAHAG